MINDYSIWYLAYQCLGWYQNLQNEQKTNRTLMEIDAVDAEPIHITGGGGGKRAQMSYDDLNNIVW